MSFLQDDETNVISIRRERLVVALFMSAMAAFFLFDILDDWYEGVALYHLGVEVLLGSFGLIMALYFFLQYAKESGVVIKKARQELVEAKRVASEWQREASSIRQGLSEAISRQLEEWKMTDAEKDIALLLLKGFSLQEIADVRKSSERTVRQQSSIIYKKSGLTGRIQLAAFFIEDFLSPSGEKS